SSKAIGRWRVADESDRRIPSGNPMRYHRPQRDLLYLSHRSTDPAAPEADMTQPESGGGGRRTLFPPAQWLPRYPPARPPRAVLAGITLAGYAIPVSLAYASLAGLPPEYGIYCYLLGGLAYALFGSSRQLAIGPTSAISMLVGTTVAGLANGDVVRAGKI